MFCVNLSFAPFTLCNLWIEQAIHGSSYKAWIHALHSTIHGLCKSMLCMYVYGTHFLKILNLPLFCFDIHHHCLLIPVSSTSPLLLHFIFFFSPLPSVPPLCGISFFPNLCTVPPSPFTFTGKGGYAYLKEWLWWTGLITSECFLFLCITLKDQHLMSMPVVDDFLHNLIITFL